MICSKRCLTVSINFYDTISNGFRVFHLRPLVKMAEEVDTKITTQLQDSPLREARGPAEQKSYNWGHTGGATS